MTEQESIVEAAIRRATEEQAEVVRQQIERMKKRRAFA